jgi:hypothetical protein
MMKTTEFPHNLTEIAKRSMAEHRLLFDFPPEVMREVSCD